MGQSTQPSQPMSIQLTHPMTNIGLPNIQYPHSFNLPVNMNMQQFVMPPPPSTFSVPQLHGQQAPQQQQQQRPPMPHPRDRKIQHDHQRRAPYHHHQQQQQRP